MAFCQLFMLCTTEYSMKDDGDDDIIVSNGTT